MTRLNKEQVMFRDTESTKRLISHLKSKHRIQVKRCYEIAAEDDQPILKSSRIESYCKSKKESISEVIARLVFVDGLTFNQIANSSLISRAFKADGYSTPKSPQTIRDHFVKEFKGGESSSQFQWFTIAKIEL